MSSSLIIRPVDSSLDWQKFYQLKERIYFPLIKNNEGALEEVQRLRSLSLTDSHLKITVFLACRNENPVGRIAAIADERHYRKQEGFFGFFECLEDQDVANELLQAAARELQSWGKETMIGPISPSTNEKVGIMIEGFHTLPHPFLTYNPSYYRKLLEGHGLTKAMELLSYLWRDNLPFPERFTIIAQRAIERYHVTLHYPARGIIQQETAIFQEVYNESLKDNWGFVPLTLREAKRVLLDYRFSSDPNLFFRLDVEGQPAGICLMQPNTRSGLRKSDPQIRVAVLGLKPQYRKKGLSTLLILKAIDFLKEGGYPSAELSLIMENNQTVRGLIEKTLQCPVLHRYHVYQVEIGSQ